MPYTARSVRAQVTEVLERSQLDGLAKEVYRVFRRFEWHARFWRNHQKRIDTYLDSHETRLLQIGSGPHVLEGWLNVDLFPQWPGVLHLDATKRFPIGSNQFDYIFSEHMIEHIPYPQGAYMLKECHRIMRTNGTIRISTPNLAFLIDLYKEEKSDLQKRYVDTVSADFGPYSDEVFVINNFVRAWGHQFIYDERTLAKSMEEAGFRNITRCRLNESEQPPLRNLENEARMPEGFLKLETLALEGTKL
jgi:predicted SAM-dependent methyltransferase